MHCNTCNKEINVLLKQEMVCFNCYDKRKAAQTQRHNHRIEAPAPVNSRVTDSSYV